MDLNIEPDNAKKKVSDDTPPMILVTGSTGFLGKRLVKTLIQKGYKVRALARKSSNIDYLKQLQVEIFFGDVCYKNSLNLPFEGVDTVVHAAANTSGNEKDSQTTTVLGTTHILDLCREGNIKKLIYISSCSVYGVADYKKGEIVTEESSLERFPEKRGHYSNAKLQADELVTKAISVEQLPIVCLRPGTIFGPGGKVFTPMIGFSFGKKFFGIIGNGKFVLPLVYIDNLADAIIIAIEKDKSVGKIYNIIDPDNPDKKTYIELLLKKLYPDARFLYIPYELLYMIVFFQEALTWLLRRRPFLTRYRLTSSQKYIKYDSSKIMKDLAWTPPVDLNKALTNILEYEKNK